MAQGHYPIAMAPGLKVITIGLLLVHIVQFCALFTQTWFYCDVVASVPPGRGLSARMMALCALGIASLTYCTFYILLHPPHHPYIKLLKRISPVTHRRLLIFRRTDAYILFPMLVAQIAVSRDASLPYSCVGLTRLNWNSRDDPNDPKPGYATIRFGDGTETGKGELDYMCPWMKVCFGLSLLSVILVVVGWLLKFMYARHLEMEWNPFSASRAPRIGQMTQQTRTVAAPTAGQQPAISTLAPTLTRTRASELAATNEHENEHENEHPPPYHRGSFDSLQADIDKKMRLEEV